MSVEAFPRGGAAAEGVVEQGKKDGKKRGASDSDALFGAKRLKRIEVVGGKKKGGGGGGGGGGEKGKGGGGGDEAAPKIGLGMLRTSSTKGGGGLGKGTLKIESLNRSKFGVASLSIGYVLQVSDSRVLVSLPGGVVGNVDRKEVSDVNYRRVGGGGGSKGKKSGEDESSEQLADLQSQLKPMQMVRCYVLGLLEKEDKSKTLSLSLRSSYINKGLAFKHLVPGFPVSGCIVSKEDHGYIVSAGVNQVNFFLPLKGIPQSLGELVVGKHDTSLVCIRVHIYIYIYCNTMRERGDGAEEEKFCRTENLQITTMLISYLVYALSHFLLLSCLACLCSPCLHYILQLLRTSTHDTFHAPFTQSL